MNNELRHKSKLSNRSSSVLTCDGSCERQFHANITKMAMDKFNDMRGTITVSQQNKSGDVKFYSTELKNKPAVIVKPKNSSNQKNSATKIDVLQEINPIKSNISISNVKIISNGGIVIGCESVNEISKFKELANEKLCDNYDTADIKSLSPRLRVVGMSEKLEEFEIVFKISKQSGLQRKF